MVIWFGWRLIFGGTLIALISLIDADRQWFKGRHGIDATAEIRRQIPAVRQPVIVALTAHALVGDRERYLAAGMDEYLTKPLRVEHLTALLSRVPELKSELRARQPR